MTQSRLQHQSTVVARTTAQPVTMQTAAAVGVCSGELNLHQLRSEDMLEVLPSTALGSAPVRIYLGSVHG